MLERRGEERREEKMRGEERKGDLVGLGQSMGISWLGSLPC